VRGSGVFPFGRPIARRRPSAKSKRRVYVLGANPAALHIAWWSPARKNIKALPVDNEPTPFWNGDDEREQIDAWKKLVHFRVGEWGEVETAGDANCARGRWVDENVLAPLGVTRDEACLSTCVDTYVADGAASFAVDERYQPFAREMALPEAQLEVRPPEAAFVEAAVEMHGERLLHEISVVVPEIVVTLGNAVLRVLRGITGAKDIRRLSVDATYGTMRPLRIGTRNTQLLALMREGTSSNVEAHARWLQSRSGS
jgi:hypothetical protein